MKEKAASLYRTGNYVAPGETRIQEDPRDDVLLRRAAKGDEDAFMLVYRRHQAAIYRFALRMTGHAWASEEIVQDVFMTLMRDPKKYDPERGPLAAYLYGIARNRVMKSLERLPREVALDDPEQTGSQARAQAVTLSTPMHWVEQQQRAECEQRCSICRPSFARRWCCANWKS